MSEFWSSYLSPKLEVRQVYGDQFGVFALQPLEQDELLAVWHGAIFRGAQLADLPAQLVSLSIQVEEDLYLVSPHPTPADRINHSCEPNAGLRGQIALVAMRPIAVGEQITFDYAMSDGSSYDEFECLCGTPSCRGYVTGQDWMRPELQVRYAGYFSPYLQKRIALLQATHQGSR
jgi:hypothetical protein